MSELTAQHDEAFRSWDERRQRLHLHLTHDIEDPDSTPADRLPATHTDKHEKRAA